jgi:hypothetical protein
VRVNDLMFSLSAIEFFKGLMHFISRKFSLGLLLLAFYATLRAQETHGDMQTQTPSQQHPAMPDMDMEHMKHGKTMEMNMGETPTTFIEEIESHSSSGSDAQPNSTPTSMLMSMKGNWMLMLHGVAFLSEQQQSGERGGDKFFSTNWVMPMAQRKFGKSTLTLRAMLSFEPATVTKRYYPELFQQGETAFSKPIVDGQHPHNFLMEVAALYDLRLGEKSLLSFYAAPVGDPAMGPTAYPHRASASENPLAALGHHLQDSTHIADDVLTLGITHSAVRLEVSGFHGREPDENRWKLDSGKINSWSTRLTVNPGQNWSGQYSFAHLASPEALHPKEDVDRMTASVTYNHPIKNGNWATLLLWGRNRSRPTGLVWNGYLAESTLQFSTRNYVWARFENVDRTSELLLKNSFEPASFEESIIGRVQASTLGYDRDIDLVPHLATAIGGRVTFYGVPDTLKPIYGSHPVGVVLFVRIRPFGKKGNP